MNTIKVYKPTNIEYQRLMKFCAKLNRKTEELQLPALFFVQNIYFDFGQDWKWTTIICDYYDKLFNNRSSYQILNPRQHESIVLNEEDKIEEIFNHCFETMQNFVK